MSPDRSELEALRIDRSGARRSRRRFPWFPRLVLLLLVAGGGWAFRRPLLDALDRLRLPAVEVARAVVQSPAAAGAVPGVAANGYVVARTRAALSADAPGRLVEMNVVEGSFVRRGDVVARLFADEVEAALAVAEARLEEARARAQTERARLAAACADLERLRAQRAAAEADLDERTAQVAFAVKDLERVRALVEERVETRSRLDEAERDLAAARAREASARARLEAARRAEASGQEAVRVAESAVAEADSAVSVAVAGRDQAAAAVERTFVRAPFDGVIVQKEAEVGEVVSPNSQGGTNARGSVATMVDLASLEVQADVPETSLAAVRLGGPARVFLDAYPEKGYRGHVDRIWPMADRQKATVEVRVAFGERDERLRPEMGVRVVFLAEEEADSTPAVEVESVVRIPVAAVVREDERTSVFLLERDRVRRREVRLGEERAGRVVVLSGLGGDEQVVVHPPATLEDGDRVRVRGADG